MSRPPFDDARLAELERKAQAATPGPWRERYAYKKDPPGTLIAATAPGHQVVTDGPGGTMPSADLSLITACSPEKVIALIREVRAARAIRDALGHAGLESNHFDAYDAIRRANEEGK